MTDRYECIRAALAMRPTPGPWRCEHETGGGHDCWMIYAGDWPRSGGIVGYYTHTGPRHIPHVRPNIEAVAIAHHIAACDPDTIRELLEERDALQAEVEALLAERDALQAENERLRAEVAEWKRVAAAQAELHGEAEERAKRLAEALKELITWIPSADTYRRLGFDPEAPMRAYEEARAIIAKAKGEQAGAAIAALTKGGAV